MGEVVELIPGATRIKKEMDGLRSLHSRMRSGLVVTEDGVDVTAREIEILGHQIDVLELALQRFIGRSDPEATRT